MPRQLRSATPPASKEYSKFNHRQNLLLTCNAVNSLLLFTEVGMLRPDIIIFGPQRTFPKPESLARLRLVLLTEPCLTKFLAAIKDLPNLWSSLLKARPALERVPGIQVLEGLKTWVERGHLARPPNPLPNTLLTPLSVVADVVHYLHFVRLREVELGESHADIISNIKSRGLQGFGVGTLAALALACSKDQQDLGVFGSVALRLAVCIGALVDLESVFSDPANEVCSLDVCLEPAKRPQVLHILERFPEVSKLAIHLSFHGPVS